MGEDRLLHKIGRAVTRVMLSPHVRRLPLARSAYTCMYVLGKTLADRRERAFLRRHVRPGMVVLDIGANVGFYSLFFSRLVGPTGRVHAFEPDPLCFDILELRSRRTRLRNLDPARVALGDREGRVTLYCSRVNRADNRVHASHSSTPTEAVEVALTTLDRYCAERGIERVDAIKIDIQGAEVAALAGMRETLTRTRPRWMFIEFSPEHLRGAGSSPEAFWKILDEYGFVPYAIDEEGKTSPIADTAAFTRRYRDGYTDVWAECRQSA